MASPLFITAALFSSTPTPVFMAASVLACAVTSCCINRVWRFISLEWVESWWTTFAATVSSPFNRVLIASLSAQTVCVCVCVCVCVYVLKEQIKGKEKEEMSIMFTPRWQRKRLALPASAPSDTNSILCFTLAVAFSSSPCFALTCRWARSSILVETISPPRLLRLLLFQEIAEEGHSVALLLSFSSSLP